ncbi:cypher [Aphomia sociella]
MWRAILLTCLITSSRGQQTRPNRVVDLSTTCDKSSVTINLDMEQPFKGLVFSKDFSRECRVQGNFQNKISLHLPSNACGVRTSALNTTVEEPDEDEDLYYNVELIVQMDKHLQQSSDQELLVRCKLQRRAVRINSSALENVITTKLREIVGQETKRVRTGRNRQGFVSPAELEHREWLMEAARAWMELSPAVAATEPATVEVGQPTRLLIQCTLPVGVGLRVTNCVAHDGLGEASQKLLDEAGCPIDEAIFNKPTIHRHKHKSTEIDFSELEPVDPQRNIDENINIKETRSDPDYMFKNIMTYQHAATTFAAFKFPDRAKLHLTCGIELCKGHCPAVDCKALQKPQQTRDGLVRKARLDKDAKGVVIDRLEVYNSIEVLAPNIELEDEASIRGSRRIEAEEDEIVRRFSPGDKTICLSPGKMALAFCVLGIIFLCAIAVAFVSLVRARRRLGREPMHTSLSFYTGSKSVFSSSESSSSGLSGSKLLLTDSPYLDHHSSSSNNWPYSRAF